MRPNLMRHGAWMAALILVGAAAPAMANVGSAMMIATATYLYIGNAIIGLIEGLLIAWLFKVPRMRAVLVMILGNYVSAFVGFFLIGFAREAILHNGVSVYELEGLIRKAFWLSALLSFLLTLLLEWPFCFWAMGPSPRRLPRSVRADLLVQTATYIGLVGLASQMGSYTLFTEVTLDPNVVSETRLDATVFYLSSDLGNLHTTKLNGQGQQKIRAVGLQDHHFADLFLRQIGEGRPWALCLGWNTPNEVLVSDVGLSTIPDFVYREDRLLDGVKTTTIHTWKLYAPPMDYRPADRRDWKVHMGWWAGLRASGQKTGLTLKVCLDTPVGTWPVQYGTILPDDKVVFEMADQILLLDLNTRRLGAIAPGRCPVVVLHAPPPATTASSTTAPP